MANGHGGSRPGAGRKRHVDVTQVRDVAQGLDYQDRASVDLTATEQVSKMSSSTKFTDAFVNYGANLGVGADNLLTSSQASFSPLTRIRVVLEWMYRGQFVVKNACDVVAVDMTREGVTLKGEIKPKDIQAIESEATRLAIWEKLCSTVKWARLYGGCLAMIMIKGQKPSTELRLETVGPDQFLGLMVLDRWMVDPSLELLVDDMASPQLGKPMFYRITADAPALPRMKIHHSRIIRLQGNELPYWQSIQENLWGLSIIETIQDRVTAFDMGSTGAAQLISKAFIRTIQIEGFKELVGTNNEAAQKLFGYMEMVRAYQGIEGLTLLDTKDVYTGHTHTAFSGLADVIEEFRQQLSGALGIPQTKLFGTSPAGMNATGESDIRTYYDMIKGQQVTTLKVGVKAVYMMIAQSLGIKLPKDFDIDFKPLWQPTEKEKAEIASSITESVVKAQESGIISPKTALLELKQSSIQTGVFSNITQDDIDAADEQAQSDDELMDSMNPPAPQGGGTPPPGAGGKPAATGAAKPAPKPASKPAPKAKDSIAEMAPAATEQMYEPGNEQLGAMPRGLDHDPGQIAPIHMEFHGLPLNIETKKGEMRYSRDPLNPWEARMAADYGFIVGTGSAEGPDEGADIFLGPFHYSTTVWAIDQAQNGAFEEVKFMLGFTTEQAAINAYVMSYDSMSSAKKRMMGITETTIEDVKKFVNDPANNFKPFSSL